jgi:hypothetical protein
MSLVSLNETHPPHALFSPTQKVSYCARCLLGFAADHTQTGLSPLDEKLKANFQKNFGFWNWLMHFLFKERTDEEVQDLFERLEQCSCNMREPNIRRYHQLGRASEGIISERVAMEKQRASISLVVKFFSLLILALGQANVRTVAKRMSPVWPTCSNDLMSFGPDNLVQGFVRWSRFIPSDTLGFKAACRVIRFCGPLVVPAFISVRFTGYVIQAGRTLVDHTWDLVRHPNLRKCKEFAVPFIQQAEPILCYFESLDDEKIELKLRLLDGYEYKAIQLFSLLQYLATDKRLLNQDFNYDFSRFIRRLQNCGTRIYNLARMAFEQIPEILVFPKMFDSIEKYLAQDRQSALEFPEHMPGANVSFCLVNARFSCDPCDPLDFMMRGDNPQISSNNFFDSEGIRDSHLKHCRFQSQLPISEFKNLLHFVYTVRSFFIDLRC